MLQHTSMIIQNSEGYSVICKFTDSVTDTQLLTNKPNGIVITPLCIAKIKTEKCWSAKWVVNVKVILKTKALCSTLNTLLEQAGKNDALEQILQHSESSNATI